MERPGTSSTEPSGRPTFRVALTADFYDERGLPKFADMGLSVLDRHQHVAYSTLGEQRPVIDVDQINGAHAVIVLTPSVTAASVSKAEGLLAICRFGVGYESVDVAACTAANVAVCIAAGAVDRSVAEATVGWMIALTHHTLPKDRLVRTGRWHERTRYMGCELRDRVFGTIGLGGIARETIRLLNGFGMKAMLAHDPYGDQAVAESLGVRLVGLNELLSAADFVSIHCPLNKSTRGMIGAQQLELMKPTAYLINTARGQIVDENALYQALKEGRIAGAAVDCFAQEPMTSPHKLGELDNVLLAPHSIAWTGELFRDIGRTVCQGIVALSLGQRPAGVVNPEVFNQSGFVEKWERVLGCTESLSRGQEL